MWKCSWEKKKQKESNFGFYFLEFIQLWKNIVRKNEKNQLKEQKFKLQSWNCVS